MKRASVLLGKTSFISTASRRKPPVTALADEPLVPIKSGLAMRRNAASRRSRALSFRYLKETPSLRAVGGFIIGIWTLIASLISLVLGYSGFALRLTTYAFGFFTIGLIFYVREILSDEKK